MSSKVCTGCGARKPLDGFPPNSNRRDGRQGACRACHGKWARARKMAKRLKVLDHLRVNPCIDCGETDPVVLTFDHRDPAQKVERIAMMLARGFAWGRIEDELGKCDVVCANCHSRRTAGQFNWMKAK